MIEWSMDVNSWQLFRVVALVAVCSTGGCGRQMERTDIHQERRQFQIVMENKMHELERKVTDLEQNVQFDDERQRADEEIAELRRNYDALDDRMNELGEVSDLNWQDARKSVESGYGDLKRRYGALLSRMVLEESSAPADTSYEAALDSAEVRASKPF